MMAIMTDKEYAKAKKLFIKSKVDNVPDIYELLTPSQNALLQKYYEVYTTNLFKQLRGTLRLEVSKAKAENLVKLKGAGEWEFAGMRDMKVKGAATCELGHPLRYVYRARNIANGQYLLFGSTCVGDFFDIDAEGVRALTRVKDVMFNEIKEIIAIKENNWFDYHTLYDCDVVGGIWKNLGPKAVCAIKDNVWGPVLRDFVAEGLPLPNSLVEELLKNKESIWKQVDDNLMLWTAEQKQSLMTIAKSDITLVKTVFRWGYQGLLSKIKIPTKPVPSEVTYLASTWDTTTLIGLETNVSLWLPRVEKLKKAQDYYKERIKTPWKEFLADKYKNDRTALGADIQYCLYLLAGFDLDTNVVEGWRNPSNTFKYSVNGVFIPFEVFERFDELFAIISKASTLKALMELEKVIEEKKNVVEVDPDTEILNYLKENLNLPKYAPLWGVSIASDIVLARGLTFNRMSQKQADLVRKVYAAMKEKDAEDKPITPVFGGSPLYANPLNDLNSSPVEEENSTYPLKDRPDIEAQIFRLKTEGAGKVDERTAAIMETVLQKNRVSDKQLKYIVEAYATVILGEEPSRKFTETSLPQSEENKKFKLADRPDIQAKIDELKSKSTYSSLPEKTKSIIETVEKYKTVSERQLKYILDAKY